MNWTSENIHLLRKHLGETQQQFADRVGLKRRQTVIDWEQGKYLPGSITCRLLDMVAAEHGFTEKVAAKLRGR